MTKEEILGYFEEMMSTRDNDMAWGFDALDLSALTADEEVTFYIRLFNETWHSNHENIATFFQLKKHPMAAEVLFRTATRADLEQFDTKPLSRKCTWALSDIGTEQAKNYLFALLTCGDNAVEGFARKRLENWERELGRKG